MQSQKLTPSIGDMLVSKGSDGGNIFDELPGQHTDYVSKLVSRMLMIIFLTLPAPKQLQMQLLTDLPDTLGMAERSAVDATGGTSSANKVSLPRPFSLVCFCGTFGRRLCPMNAPTRPSPPPQTQSRLICGASPAYVLKYADTSARAAATSTSPPPRPQAPFPTSAARPLPGAPRASPPALCVGR